MRVRTTDNKNDWTFGQGQSNFATELNAIIFDIHMRLKEWYQDCFFNLTQGIPWDVRLGSHNQKELTDQDVIQTVSDIDGVLNVFNFESYVNGRKYTCKFDIYTIYSGEAVTINFEGI